MLLSLTTGYEVPPQGESVDYCVTLYVYMFYYIVCLYVILY